MANSLIKVIVANETLENQKQPEEPEVNVKREITEWNLRLANYDTILPEDFEVELANIDETKQFDARAIKYLNEMMSDIRKDGISNIWVQSAYRSVERQKELYDNSVQKYLKQGKTQEEAEKLTDDYINKPGSSDHNLGLAVDFNNVDNKFEDLDAFKWLKENAENYGFVLRYPKHKEDITKNFIVHYYFLKYEHLIRSQILAIKFHEKPYIYKTIAFFLKNMQKSFEKLKNYDIIITVPISKQRKRERGYNQSYLIAKEISQIIKVPIVSNILYKTKNTARLLE